MSTNPQSYLYRKKYPTGTHQKFDKSSVGTTPTILGAKIQTMCTYVMNPTIIAISMCHRLRIFALCQALA